MKIETKGEPNAKIKLVSGSAFAIQTAPHLPVLRPDTAQFQAHYELLGLADKDWMDYHK
mgnify:CR=1 FL=1